MPTVKETHLCQRNTSGVREDDVGKYENRESVRVDRRDGVMGSRV